MRFARSLSMALLVSITGCATVTDSMKALKDAVTPSSSSSSTNAGATKPAAAAPQNDTPVPLAVQRAFDDALRALRANRLDEAERGFRALTQSNPELGGPYANLGVIHRQQNKLAESASDLEQAVKLSPNQPIYLNQLGITYRQQGQFDKARDAYQRAIAADANYAAPTLNLGILYDLYLGDSAKALELYDRYLALSPGGDPAVTKWVAELKNRKPVSAVAMGKKEKA
ncbi:MAG TPA: tetratricopeptide repeat protein [Burkholderiaceae bacterium]